MGFESGDTVGGLDRDGHIGQGFRRLVGPVGDQLAVPDDATDLLGFEHVAATVPIVDHVTVREGADEEGEVNRPFVVLEHGERDRGGATLQGNGKLVVSGPIRFAFLSDPGEPDLAVVVESVSKGRPSHEGELVPLEDGTLFAIDCDAPSHEDHHHGDKEDDDLGDQKEEGDVPVIFVEEECEEVFAQEQPQSGTDDDEASAATSEDDL
jgi:hypothetical protein